MICLQRVWACFAISMIAGLTVAGSPQAQRPESLEAIRRLIVDGRYADAEAAGRKELAVVEATSGNQSVEAAQVLDALVESLRRGGKAALPETRTLAERAVTIKERSIGLEHADLAESLLNLGWVVRLAGDAAAARPVFERAVAIREKALGPDHPDVADILNGLGLALVEIGDHTQAREVLERAVRIRERALGPDHSLVGVSLNNLAVMLEREGDFPAARPLRERVLSIMEKSVSPDHPLLAYAVHNLAVVMRSMGEIETAAGLYERTLGMFERASGPDHPDVAQALYNFAEALMELGDLDRARRLFDREITLRESHAMPEPHRIGFSYTALGTLLTRTGELDRAGRLFEKALAIREAAFGPDHPLVAETLNWFAELLQAEGQNERARRFSERAIAIWEKAFGPDPTRAIPARVRLAELLLVTGELDAAVSTALSAEASRRNHLGLALRTLPERQALSYVVVWASAIDALLSLAAREERATRTRADILDAVIRSRALVLDEIASRHRTISAADDPALAILARAYTETRTRFARLLVRTVSDAAPAVRATLQRAQLESEQAERALAQASVVFRAELAHRRAGLIEVADALPPDSALVSLVSYRADPDGHHLENQRPPVSEADSYLAFVLRAGAREPIVVRLGSLTEIDKSVTAWRRQILHEAMAPRGASRGSETAYRKTGMSLREKIWDPLVAHLRDAQRVFIVPDGQLHLVDFATLPTGPGRYLAESGPELHYLSAERDVVGRSKVERGDGLLVLGAPAYNQRSAAAALVDPRPGGTVSIAVPAPPGRRLFRGPGPACGGFQALRFEPLPGSAREAADVASVWERGRAGTAGRHPAAAGGQANPMHRMQNLHGTGATETAFKLTAPGRRVLHLATHGFFLDGACRSPDAAGSGVRPTPDVPTGTRPASPLLLSGLAFAGANRRTAAAPDEDDGVLTAEEIGAMDLSGVEWAVLSACDTGVGELKTGEGVLGLRRAFQVAGARTVIMSLWPVDDDGARRWMRSLYEHRFLRGLSTIAAVRQANLEQLRRRRASGLSTHPFYWGGFIAAGEWR